MTHRFTALAALAFATTLAGCDGADMEINGQKGVPLADIATMDTAPTEVVLASGDTVILTDGPTFTIKVEGSDTESLRFVRDAEVIGITREEGWSGKSSATIRITMPPPKEVVIAGSGTVKGAGSAKRLEVNIGGAGDVLLTALKADSAEVSIGGSGDVAFASDGDVTANIAGAGDVKVAGNAKCTVNAFGSGTLTCTPTSAGAAAAPEAKPAE